MEYLLVAVVIAVVAWLLWTSRTSTKSRRQSLESYERRSSMSHIPENELETQSALARVVDPNTGQEVIVTDGETPSRALQRAARVDEQTAAAAQQAPHGAGATGSASDMFAFAGIRVRNGNITYGSEMQPVSGTRATVETAGQIRERTSVTQTVAGGLLFGPVGAIIGALVKGEVDDRELYLLVEGSDYAWAIDVNPKKGVEARKFAARVNTAARQG